MFHVHEQQGAVQTQAAKVITQKTGTNFIEVKNDDGSITLLSDKTVTIKTGQSSLTLNKDGTIDLKGVVININGTTSVGTTSKAITTSATETVAIDAKSSISSVTKGLHTIHGGEVDIN
jgi:autotransporter adhesin